MLLITGVTAITLNARREIIRDAAIAVAGRQIAAVGKAAELERRYPEAERLAGRGLYALPGLVDAHTHTDQALLRSVADELPWQPFLNNYIWPILARRTPEDALLSLRLCMLEMIKAGITCFVDSIIPWHYPFDAWAQTVADMGLRAVLTRYVMPEAAFAEAEEAKTRGLRDEAEAFELAARAIARWHGAAEGRLQVWYGPVVPREPAETCAPEFYLRVAEAAARHNTGITIHFAAEREDVEFLRRSYGLSPGEFARRYGLLGANVLLIGATHLDEAAIPLLAESGTKVAHSPSASMKMASGIARVPQMRAAGVTVALGCDAGANNNAHDILREMKMAALLADITQMDPAALTAEDALEMATLDGARAILQEAAIGSLEAGKQADLILVDLNQPHTMPVHDPISNLVYAAHGGNVDTVMVAGRLLMQRRRVLVVDEAALLAEAAEVGRRLLERAGVRVAPAWPVL